MVTYQQRLDLLACIDGHCNENYKKTGKKLTPYRFFNINKNSYNSRPLFDAIRILSAFNLINPSASFWL